ncbi:hypothetical protein [Haloplanus pelagicus]|jgi:hypothetical protein|uniref:hypothetical protein n=1 Tax=Haloplanus pelagicus TaxID=2949995 RepID=UPI00203EF365|nr:hypothetical protein [Haloplanus sp. HW8-1]
MDPEVLRVRVDTDRQPVWLANKDGEDDGRPTPRPDARHIDSEVIDSEARAGRLSVDSEVDRPRVASFLSEPDFSDETVVVETIQVEECFRLKLCRIGWQSEMVSTDYTRRSRHWDEHCAVDERVFESRLIRIPGAAGARSVAERSPLLGLKRSKSRVPNTLKITAGKMSRSYDSAPRARRKDGANSSDHPVDVIGTTTVSCALQTCVY